MSAIIKYAAVMITAILVITVCVLFFGGNKTSSKISASAEKAVKLEAVTEQYNIFFNFNGDKTQIIDLIQGDAVLKLDYPGSSKFTARLLNTDGTLFSILADKDGPVSEKQTVLIPASGPYLLDVKTIGPWSLNRD